MEIRIIVVASILSLVGCGLNDKPKISEIASYNERHRPQFHFSPKANWMNDPNGMVYLEGEYHLFYQHYPEKAVWGPMHWGHAISKDLNHWEHLPVAIYPDSLGWIFSGGAVYDKDNTSGLGKNGKGPLVAIFTQHNSELEKAGSDKYQYQSIAFSNDQGRSWTKYEGNPVVENPGIRDFRDPKVIWYEPDKKWIMTVAALDHVRFYSSPNLREWEYLSDFGKAIGSHEGVWECPDLFPLTSSSGKVFWVLLQNMNPGNPNGGSGIQYFIGQFDGKKFEVDPQFAKLLKPIPAQAPKGIVFEDFEKGYGAWEVTGKAFGKAPSNGALFGQNEVKDYEGNGLVNSFNGGDEYIGELISPEFVISSDYINFKIGGGNHRGRTLMALEVENIRVREAEGKNNEKLEWRGWNVAPFKGKRARLRIIDNHSGSWGHINIDQIVFANEPAHEEVSGSVWLDAGRDNYAGVTWDNAPNPPTDRTFIGWMSNWAYAQVVPTDKWRSAATLPWKLSIEEINDIPRLLGKPIISQSILTKSKSKIQGKTQLPVSGLANIKLSAANITDVVVVKFSNDYGEYILLQYDPDNSHLVLDRSHSGDGSFSSDFLSAASVKRIEEKKPISFDIFLDHSSIEVFVDGGKNIFTELFFPTKPFNYIEVEGVNGSIQEIKRIWN